LFSSHHFTIDCRRLSTSGLTTTSRRTARLCSSTTSTPSPPVTSRPSRRCLPPCRYETLHRPPPQVSASPSNPPDPVRRHMGLPSPPPSPPTHHRLARIGRQSRTGKGGGTSPTTTHRLKAPSGSGHSDRGGVPDLSVSGDNFNLVEDDPHDPTTTSEPEAPMQSLNQLLVVTNLVDARSA
jgi:hypothetical protein